MFHVVKVIVHFRCVHRLLEHAVGRLVASTLHIALVFVIHLVEDSLALPFPMHVHATESFGAE
jgi:hypothetical protein